MIRHLNRGFCLVLILLIATAASAEVKVGDRPQIDWKTINNEPITSELLAGRIVVVDFWATWCGPCMQELPHMLQLYRDTHERGIVFVGISLDSDRGALASTIRSRKIPWPQVCDYKGWDNAVANAWGVRSIPRVFILTPEGEVFWTGHPAHIDDALRDVIEKHPPKQPEAVDNTLRDEALGLLAEATQALDDGDFAAVLKKAAQVNAEVLSDRKVRTAVGMLLRKVQVQAADKDGWKAALEADPESAAAIKKLGEALLAPPPAASSAANQAELAAASNPRLVAAKLAQAEKAHEAKDYFAAWKCYDWLKRLAYDSEAGKAAAARLAEYEADEAISHTIRVQQAEADANATLCLARNYQQAGNLDLAKENYQKLLDEHPDAEQACAEARTALKDMD